MSLPSPAEREERFERDDGPLDGTVFAGLHQGRSTMAYHDTRDCHRVKNPETLREWTREAAQQTDKVPCKACVLDEANYSKTLEAECPFCGAAVKRLPAHLPCDGAAEVGVER